MTILSLNALLHANCVLWIDDQLHSRHAVSVAQWQHGASLSSSVRR